MAIGGMVGGGIFAVLRVVAVEAGPAAWLVFVASDVIAFCAGYSALRLNAQSDDQLHPIAYITQFTWSTTRIPHSFTAESNMSSVSGSTIGSLSDRPFSTFAATRTGSYVGLNGGAYARSRYSTSVVVMPA